MEDPKIAHRRRVIFRFTFAVINIFLVLSLIASYFAYEAQKAATIQAAQARLKTEQAQKVVEQQKWQIDSLKKVIEYLKQK